MPTEELTGPAPGAVHTPEGGISADRRSLLLCFDNARVVRGDICHGWPLLKAQVGLNHERVVRLQG